MKQTSFGTISGFGHPGEDKDFSRLHESDDRVFYATDRFVSHLDRIALETVEKIVDTLVIEKDPHILDLMAGWDSHIPERLRSSIIVGLGLNQNELQQNKVLSQFVIHDLNRVPRLPFRDNTFDVVINTVSVDYMTKPVEVFKEAGRILKPGGLFLVMFSNRMFPEKAVGVWRRSNEEERTLLVEDYFRESRLFDETTLFVSQGRPRPEDDKYADRGIPSDPIYAVYAEKQGGHPDRKPRPRISIPYGAVPDEKDLEERKRRVKATLQCPHCGEKLKKWAVPDNPFAFTWDNEFMYICFNDRCPYYIRGWDHMAGKGNRGVSYRLMYYPEKDICMPIPVPSPRALRESIVE